MTRVTLLAGMALCAAGAPLHSQSPERFILNGNRIAIYNIAGRVTVGPAAGSAVTVEVTRAGAHGRQLRVDTGDIEGFATLRVIYPAGDIQYQENNWNGQTQLQVRSDGTFGQGGDWRERDRGERVRVSSRGGGVDAHADLRIGVPAGKNVSVYLGVGALTASNVQGDLRLDASAANISVERLKGSIDLDTGSGDITAAGMEGDELNVDTGSGDVRVTGASGRTITIDTGSGEVTGSDITANSLDVDTGSGGIDLTGVRARILRMDTGSGDISVGLLGDTELIEIDAGSGDVTVGVPAGFGSAVNLSTSSGDLRTDLEIQVTRRSREHLVGRIGDGQGRMAIETGSGDIHIRSSR